MTAHQSGRLADAEAAYRAALDRSPDHPVALNYLGALLAGTGRVEAGIDLIRRSLKHAANVPEFHLNLADALAATGRLEAAAAAVRKALSLKKSADGLAKLGLLLFRQNKLRPAMHQFEQALAMDPAHLQALQNLAIVTSQLGELSAGRALLRGLAALAPAHVEGLSALAGLEQGLGEVRSAAARLNRVLALMPAYASAQANYGLVLEAMGQPENAARHARKALALAPGDPRVWTNLANVTTKTRGPASGEAMLRRVLAIRADDADDWSNLGRMLNAQSKHNAALAVYRHALELDPDHNVAHSNLIFLLDLHPDATFAEAQEERRRWFARHGGKHAARVKLHRNDPDPHRRIRLGYVSADFNNHSAQSVFGPIIRRHDPAAVDVACYSGVVVEDAVTRTLRAASSIWRSTVGQRADAVTAQIEADAIDILIDLSSFTSGHRLDVFARKPAPVQVTAWGYANGTGLPTVDYFFADPVLIPKDIRHLYAEEIYDLPCCIAFDPPSAAPPLGSSAPPGEELIFGSFNRISKIGDDLLAVWSRILRALPRSRLLMKDVAFDDANVRDQVLATFARNGVDAARIETQGRTSRFEHLAAMSRAHISFDPFPHNGGVTTFESVFMATPAIALLGHTTPGRASAAVLTALGLADWIAGDPEAYVSLAVEKASDIARHGVARSTIRQQFLASPATDMDRYTRAAEAAYRDIWQRWCVQRTGNGAAAGRRARPNTAK